MARTNRMSSRIFWGFFASFLILLGASGVFLLVWFTGAQKAVNPLDTQSQMFVVARGQSVASIGRALKNQGLIHSELVFKLETNRLGMAKQIQAGTFKLSPSMNLPDLIKTLTKGKVVDFWVTLLEGWRREEVASELSQAFKQHDLAFSEQLFLELTNKYEGHLFPDSYLIPITASEKTVADLLIATFNDRTSNLSLAANSQGLSETEVITLASIVEREARQHESRRMVAGILLNRLELNMPLQVDASLQYIKGKAGNWWPEPLAADKSIDSAYNTYLYPGLPPGPIANPSLSSIQAVVDPVDSDYLYYLTGNDNAMHYAKSYEEHLDNIDRFLY